MTRVALLITLLPQPPGHSSGDLLTLPLSAFGFQG